jgi:hypothetical protein
MNTTIVLAQVLGIILTVVGLSLLVARKATIAALEEFSRNPGMLWLYGFIALVFGATLVALNNVWDGTGVALTITIIGWLALLKGIFVLLFPGSAATVYRKWNKSGLILLTGFVVLIIGLIFLIQ